MDPTASLKRALRKTYFERGGVCPTLGTSGHKKTTTGVEVLEGIGSSRNDRQIPKRRTPGRPGQTKTESQILRGESGIFMSASRKREGVAEPLRLYDPKRLTTMSGVRAVLEGKGGMLAKRRRKLEVRGREGRVERGLCLSRSRGKSSPCISRL